MSRPEDAAPAGGASLVDAELTPAEVGELWSFLHGDIMEPSIRQLLRASLGLCPRHAWGYAATEIELWQTGAGLRGGHQPFDVAVLYADLLDHVAVQLTKSPGLFHHDLRRALVPRAACSVCALLRPGGGSAGGASRIGYGGTPTAELASETNRLAHTTAWCRDTWSQWRAEVCPSCFATWKDGVDQILGVDQVHDEDADCGRLCRLHLILNPVTTDCGHIAAERLESIAVRLRRLISSMTDDGPAATPEDDSSWIEALGWFAGWRVPLALGTA